MKTILKLDCIVYFGNIAQGIAKKNDNIAEEGDTSRCTRCR